MTLRVKHNNTWKVPSAIYVKRNGSWVVANETYLKRNGSWVKNYSSTPPSLVIFDASTTPNSTVTGGWYSVRAGGTTNPVLSVSSTSVGLRAPYWCDGDAYTNNNINFAGAKSMTISVSASGNTASYFYANINWPLAAGGEAGYSLGSPSNANYATTSITIPITGGGNGRLRFRVTNSSGGYVYLYSIVLNY